MLPILPGPGAGAVMRKSWRPDFRDCLLFYLDGRIRFERYCYGEAACLVFSVWAHGFDADGNIYGTANRSLRARKPPFPAC